MYPRDVYGTLGGLGPTAKLVYLYFVDAAGSNGAAWPKLSTVAADLGLNQPTVKVAMRRLRATGRLIPDGWGPGRPGRQARRYKVPPP